MKSYRKELWFNLPKRGGFVNISSEVEKALAESGIRDGLCLVNAMHITASVFINDDELGLLHDYEEWLEGLAPHEPVGKYWHNRTGEDNADAHIKAPGDGTRSGGGGDRRPAGLWSVGADFLWRVRWPQTEARAG